MIVAPYYGRSDRDAYLRQLAATVRESCGLHAGIQIERMIQDLYADLDARPICSAWQTDSE